MTARPSSIARLVALAAARRACHVYNQTSLVTPADLVAADKRMYRALVAAGWSLGSSAHEERQIKEAFVDGYLTGAYPMGAGNLQEAEEAWREHNTTSRAAPGGQESR